MFNKIYLIENRHILKNISLTIKEIFNKDVPADKPGVISFSYDMEIQRYYCIDTQSYFDADDGDLGMNQAMHYLLK